ncbi:hypothetical protein [Allocoleopsis franciscana]|uniref:hypothetical protein n=1 Tax=Allocoleopsis franciscana TaxID=2886352 RepID=UPI000308AA75|nr:hypothetical protein [Allocoleopsis franciscana]
MAGLTKEVYSSQGYRIFAEDCQTEGRLPTVSPKKRSLYSLVNKFHKLTNSHQLKSDRQLEPVAIAISY